MESYATTLDVTVDFGLLPDGGVQIVIESSCGSCSKRMIADQTISLPVEQSKALYEQLKEHFEHEESVLTEELTLPEEPKEAGWYLTQSGELLCKDDDDDWNRFSDCGDELSWVTKDSEYIAYTRDWNDVLRTLDDSEFPLVPISQDQRAQYAKTSIAQSKE